MELYPLRFAPIYKAKIWGGRSLERLFGRRLPAHEKIGESWELADIREGTSVLSNGPEAGKTLTELTVKLGRELLGVTTRSDPKACNTQTEAHPSKTAHGRLVNRKGTPKTREIGGSLGVLVSRGEARARRAKPGARGAAKLERSDERGGRTKGGGGWVGFRRAA